MATLAVNAAKHSSVFVLIFMCLCVAVCSGTLAEAKRQVNTFFEIFLNENQKKWLPAGNAEIASLPKDQRTRRQ